ncbi:hypothetical protein VTI28DRAFT_3068 [Corynascus sepedonium]
MPREAPTFLTIPLEIRLEIYSHFLVLPEPPPPEILQTTHRCSFAASTSPGSLTTKTNNRPTLYPQILRVNTQTYHEALPILYSQNIFSAHPVLLTAQPALYYPYCSPCRPVITPLGVSYICSQSTHTFFGRGRTALATTNPNIKLIRKWHLRVRLDTAAAATGSFKKTAPARAGSLGQGGNQAALSPTSPTAITSNSSSSSDSLAAHRQYQHRDVLELEEEEEEEENDDDDEEHEKEEEKDQSAGPNPIAAAFSNADSLTLDLWQAGVHTVVAGLSGESGSGKGGGGRGGEESAPSPPAALRPFEDVRGVRHVHIVGATAGIEAYVTWLRGRMMKGNRRRRVAERAETRTETGVSVVSPLEKMESEY